jgi:hypothetical protein
MKYFISIFFMLIFSSLYPQTKIIGGGEIAIEDAPWTANMRIVNTAGIRLFNRSGIVISENLILTAAHNWPDYEYDHLEVHVGGAYNGAGQYCRVHRFVSHPDKDIALLELSEPLKFGKNIQSIDYRSCVDESLYVPETNAMIYGWGRTVPDVPAQSLKLRATSVKIISPQKANEIYGASVISANYLVSTGENIISMGGKGDSGGPLVVPDRQQNPVLAGIILYVDARNETENSSLTVYAKAKQIIEWIDSHKCEIVGKDTVSPLGSSFEIVNMPPGAESVEWTYSGLTEINSTTDCSSVIPSGVEKETTGYVNAKITTDLGTLTVSKKLVIMPRIDIDINIRYNSVASKYEMLAKTVNMSTIDDRDILKCKNISDNTKLLGFVWNYDKNIAVGQEAIFNINPNPPKTHTISVTKYGCDYTVKLEKTFVIRHGNNEFITVYYEPGTISIGGTHLSVDVETFEELQMTYVKNAVQNCILLNTSGVKVRNTSQKTVITGNYRISLYSRNGNMLYSGNFDSSKGVLHIDTSVFHPDIYIMFIQNLDSGRTAGRMLMINQ